MARQQQIEASLNYLGDTDTRPEVYLYTPPEGTVQNRPPRIAHTVSISDARDIGATLDREGFALRRYDTRVADFYDDDEVRSIYFPEVERLVKEVTGASRVLVFDYNVRCASMAQRRENNAQMPVKSAHNDYTVRSGPQRVRDLLPDDADALLQNRFSIVNVWRPIRGPVHKHPLAVCDATTMDLDDFVATDLKYRDRTGEVSLLRFNPRHAWYYIPEMRADDVLLIKCFDSSEDGGARFTAHSAFDDPTSAPDAEDRESIEVRTLAFFAPDA